MERIDFERRKKNQGPPTQQICEWCGFRRQGVNRIPCPRCGTGSMKTVRNERRK